MDSSKKIHLTYAIFFVTQIITAILVAAGTTYYMMFGSGLLEKIATEIAIEVVENQIDAVTASGSEATLDQKRDPSILPERAQQVSQRTQEITQEYFKVEEELNRLYAEADAYGDDTLIPEELQQKIEDTQAELDRLFESL